LAGRSHLTQEFWDLWWKSKNCLCTNGCPWLHFTDYIIIIVIIVEIGILFIYKQVPLVTQADKVKACTIIMALNKEIISKIQKIMIV